MGGCILQKRLIGETGIEVSVIGLGTVKFGRNQGVKYPTAFTLPSDDEIENLLSVAMESGINLLDTAPAYGSSEERLGKWLRGKRHDWVISTKAGEEFIEGESYYDFLPSAMIQSVERSLQRLNTDYLDIVFVHSNGDDLRIIEQEEVFSTLSALKKAGKIRAYGMSTKTVAGGLLTIDSADIAMVTYNPVCTDDRYVIQYAHKKQKGIFIKKALASGHMPVSVADSMQFIFEEQGVSSVVIGTVNPNHLREVVGCTMDFLQREEEWGRRDLCC
ncbi:MAG: aldo/keto reductase [Gammaproteobacteria bacterium]|nr:aldo/keto reductase [Gammaproteobacteria bacterium]MCW5584240.1 aldo/keto reductase [Gammaproteobacteria bacterium]